MIRVRHIVPLACLGLSAACAPHIVSPGSPAPTAPPLGQWLRASHCPSGDCNQRHTTYEGYLIGLEGNTLVLHASGPKGRGYRLELPTGWLTKIELYRGNKRTAAAVAKGAGKGGLLGAVLGAFAGLAGAILGEALDFSDSHDSRIVEGLAGGAAAGAVYGAGAGAVGGFMEGESQWEEITLDRVRAILCRQHGGGNCPAPTAVSEPKSPPDILGEPDLE